MFQAVADWLRTSARRRPVMLVLDDLQWAAQPTLLLLRHLVRMPDLEGLFLVATYRDTKPERSEELDEILGDLVARHGASNGWSSKDSTWPRSTSCSCATRVRPATKRPRKTRGADPRRDRGEPVLRARADPPSRRARRGGRRSRRASATWSRNGSARLPNEVEDLLNTAAVIGRHFDFALLQRGERHRRGHSARTSSTAALEARLVQETGFDEYEFAHTLVQSALYDR